MICKSFVARRVLTTLIKRKEKLKELPMSELEWKLVEDISTFKEAVANTTYHELGSLYVTTSVTPKLFHG